MTTINVWERIGDKHLAQLVEEGACQPDIFTTYRLVCELSYGTCPISLCALKPLLFKVMLWPNFGHNKCMGENSRKSLSTARGRGGVST